MARLNNVWVSFKGVKSSSIGFRLTKLPDRPMAELKASIQSIPGRNGDLTISEDAYKDIDIKVTLQATENADYKAFGEWLKGRGDLIFSDMEFSEVGQELPNAYAYTGRVIKAIANKHARTFCGVESYDIVFHCEPLKHLLREDKIEWDDEETGDFVEFDGQGNVESRPLIKITGTGTVNVMVNSEYSLQVDDIEPYVIIDCESMMAYSGTENRSSSVTIINDDDHEDDFPQLRTTHNEVHVTEVSGTSAHVDSYEITPRWRWR